MERNAHRRKNKKLFMKKNWFLKETLILRNHFWAQFGNFEGLFAPSVTPVSERILELLNSSQNAPASNILNPTNTKSFRCVLLNSKY